MDNLTHSFVGLAASKAGLERLSPGTSAVCLLAANAPDVDIVSLFFGDRWTYLHHHRGITHSFVGTLTLALAIPLVFFAVERLIARLRNKKPKIRLLGLMVASLVVSATHPFMDWTNNYGIRLLLPWDSKWFYGDFVFIVDPFIWFMIGGAAFLLTSKTKKQLAFWLMLGSLLTFVVLFAANRSPFGNFGWIRAMWVAMLVVLIVCRLKLVPRWGERIAITSFALMLIYWGGLWTLHQIALRKGNQEATRIAESHGEHVRLLAAMPTLANPFHWQVAFETDPAAYRFDVFMFSGDSQQTVLRYERPEAVSSEVVSRALEDRRAVVFREFARFPVVRVEDPNCTSQTLVQLADLRYTEPGSSRGTFALEIPVECPAQISGDNR